MYCYFFFFQAEDGIRDRDVTGVQTCALPISPVSSRPFQMVCILGTRRPSSSRWTAARRRSEERREGKSVDLGGRRIIKKKKKSKKKEEQKNKGQTKEKHSERSS